MPRTIESILACHQAAHSLRAKGKPIWPMRIDIKSILREEAHDESPEHVTRIANRIAKMLRAYLPRSAFDEKSDTVDFDFIDAIEMMEACTTASLASDADNGHEAVDMLNRWLETLYDWADANRLWLG